MSFPVAVQLYSVREDAQKDLGAVLAEIKKMGYDGVEFAGLYGKTPAEVRGLCEQNGLVPLSAHVGFADMLKDPVGVLSQYAEIGCKYVAIPSMPKELRPGTPNFPYTMEYIAILARVAGSLGIRFLYHNHDFEFMKLGGKPALDVLYDTIPAVLLATELDTCWVNVGGEEPSEYIRKYTGRAPVIHLKDFFGEREGLEGASEGKAPARPVNFEYRPVGKGLQDIPAILGAAHDAGAEWVVVEQDSPSMGLTPMECIRASIDYLKTVNI